MSRPRYSILLWLAFGLAATLAFLTGCESKPAAPAFNNPFDPTGPDGGDPLQLTANVIDGGVLLMWKQPQGFGITTYDISHSFDSVTDYEYVATVDATTAATNQYTYENPDPTQVHYFKVQAFNAAGDFTFVADQSPAFVATGPSLAVNGDPVGKKIPSRHLHLTVTVYSPDSFLVAASPDFSDAVSYQVITPGVGQDITWELPPAAQGDTLTLYAKGYTGSFASAVTVRELIVDFAPGFNIVGKPATVPSRTVDLEIEADGVEQMRFALGEQDLASAAWLPADSTLAGFILGASAVPQTIYGEFQGDFGFNATATWDVSPDLLQDVAFTLDLPDGDVTSATTVTGLCQAGATLMRFSTRPDFLAATWQEYADTASINLDEVEGLQTIYAQYRNDWTDSDILTDTVVHVLQPVTVGFLAPLDGQVILGGVPLQIRGHSVGASGKAAVDSVGVDLGDGEGFRPVTGTDTWSYLWQVPRFEADTPLTLRARAWAAGDSATAVIDVTVTQMVLVIADPLDGAELAADTDVTIAGTAGGLLGGAAIDQVTVAVDDQVLTAEGTDIWSATWHTPAVTQSTAFTITVTARAGDDSLTREISVTVVPPAM